MMKPVGKPDAGNLHVRFDERGEETERVSARHRASPRLYWSWRTCKAYPYLAGQNATPGPFWGLLIPVRRRDGD
jgi:hypothetical protein